MTIGVYCRVSTQSQKDNESLGLQERLGREFCEKNNYQYIIYKDVISGTKKGEERPEFGRLQHDLYSKKVDGIWIYDYDRMIRELGVGVIFRDLILETKCKLFVGQEEKKLDEDMDSLEFGIGTVFSDYWRRKLTRVMRNGKYEKWRRGEGLNKVGIGYKLDELGKVVPDKDTEMIVRDVHKFFNYKTVKSYEEVLRRIRKKYGKVKGLGSSSRVRELLINTKYLGEYILTDKYGEEFKFEFEPIIDQETFNRSQEKVKYIVGLRRSYMKEEYLLKGKLICGDCGERLWVKGGGNDKNGKPYRYHFCPSLKVKERSERNLSKRKFKLCESVNKKSNLISKDILESVVWDSLHEILKNSKSLEREYTKRFKEKQGVKDRDKGTLKHYEKKLVDLEQRKVVMLDNFSNGMFDIDEYKLWKDEKYLPEVKNLTKQINDLKREISKTDTKEDIDSYLTLLREDLKKTFSNDRFRSRRRVIEQYVKYVSVKRVTDSTSEFEIRIKLFFEEDNQESDDNMVDYSKRDGIKVYELKNESLEIWGL